MPAAPPMPPAPPAPKPAAGRPVAGSANRRAPRSAGTDLEATLAKLARVLTRRHGIAVVFGPGPARVEVGRIIVPPPELMSGLSEEGARDILTGYVDLLAARCQHVALDALDALPGVLERTLAQVIDERRACAALTREFDGARWFLGALRRHAAARTARDWGKLSWNQRFAWLVESALWDEAARALPGTCVVGPALRAALGAAQPALDAARASRSTHESIDYARRIVTAIRALDAGAVNNMMLAARPEDRNDQDGPADGEEAVTEAAEREALDEALSATRPLGGSASDAERAAGMGHAPFAAPLDGDSGPAPAAAPFIKPTLSVPLSSEFDTVTDHTALGEAAAWLDLRARARAQTGSLRARLERALTADEWTHWHLEQERGEIDRSALARLVTAPGYRTPFKVKRVKPGRDTAITVLLDLSGSMAGNKIELARLCAAALADALVQLDFACEVLGYSSIEVPALRAMVDTQRAAGADLRAYNRLVEKLDLQVFKRFDSADPSGIAAIACGHENPDGECLAWAASRLAAQPAGRRILMVLSDGAPATGDGDPGVLQSDLHARVAQLMRDGIELVGIGILDDAVQTFYPLSVVVRTLAELPGAALNALGALLLKRRGTRARPG